MTPITKKKTKLKRFCFENDIVLKDLCYNHIRIEALKKNAYPLSWAQLNKLVQGHVDALRSIRQISEGLSSYLGRKVNLIEILDVEDEETNNNN